MKTLRHVIACLLCGASLPMFAVMQPADEVDVFMGTSNARWMIFPGATLPFGLVKCSPDNQGHVWNGGYEYTIASISGFSHLHAMSLSGVSLMPVVGPVESKLFPGPPDGPFGGMRTSGYRSRIRKETEHASPGSCSTLIFPRKNGRKFSPSRQGRPARWKLKGPSGTTTSTRSNSRCILCSS